MNLVIRAGRRHLLPLAALVMASAAHAQLVHPGSGVRVRAPGVFLERFEGVYIGRSADTVLFGNEERGPVRVPVAAITTLDLSRGRSRWRGALVGALWGAGIGAILGAIANTDSTDVSRGDAMAFLVLGGAETGAIIGAIVGRRVWIAAQPSVLTTTTLERARGARVALVVR